MATVSKFRIENVHSLLMNSGSQGPEVPVSHGLSLPEPVYPRFSEKLSDPDQRCRRNRVTGHSLRPIAA